MPSAERSQHILQRHARWNGGGTHPGFLAVGRGSRMWLAWQKEEPVRPRVGLAESPPAASQCRSCGRSLPPRTDGGGAVRLSLSLPLPLALTPCLGSYGIGSGDRGSARPNPSKGTSEGRGCGAGRPHGGRTRIDAGWTDRRRNLTALERATLTIHESTQSNEEHFLVNFLPSFTCQFIVKIVFEFSTIFLFHMITFFTLKPCR